MRMPRQDTVQDWLKAAALWIALGVSLGLYYRCRRGGIVLPHPESAATALFYFGAGARDSCGRTQAALWLGGVLGASLCWVTIQTLLARFYGGRRAIFSVSLVRSGAAATPIALLGLWLIVKAGESPSGWQFSRVWDIAVGQSVMRSLPYLDYWYATAGLLALAIELRLFWTAFDLKGRRAINHFLASLMLLGLTAFGAGTAAAFALPRGS